MARREIGLRRVAALVAVLAATACGGGGDQGNAAEADSAAASAQEAESPQRESAAQDAQAGESAALILTEGDLDSYRKGMRAEIDDVKKKVGALASAANGTDSLDALGELSNEANRTQAGADGAGIPLARYQRLTSAVNEVLGAYSVSQMLTKTQSGVDTSSLSEDARARVRENLEQAEAGLARLPQQNVQLVIPHAAELDSLRLLPPALALKAASGA
jgi:hypothetical protein